MTNFKNILKNLLVFKVPAPKEKFVLIEDENKEQRKKTESSYIDNKPKPGKKLGKRIIKRLTGINSLSKGSPERKKTSGQISKDLSENLKFIKEKFNIPDNSDIIIREFDIVVKNKSVAAFIVFIDGIVDRMLINQLILQPLMLLSGLDIKSNEQDLASYISRRLLPQNQITREKEYSKITSQIVFGSCVIFIDGVAEAFAADVKGWQNRMVNRPNTELVIRGPQEGFTEILRTNTALVRKILKYEKLMIEISKVGNKSETPCAILYIKDIVNDNLVKEIKRRIKGINTDYIIDSGELEQYIEDNTFTPAPQVISTERPDRVAAALIEGKAAVLLHGSPFALIVPCTFIELLHSGEDAYIRFPYSNLLRLIRFLGLIMALLLPATYIAVTNYHHEMIPTDLLMAIVAAREIVPFPAVVEILIMEVSFELIREAGIRIPGPIGPTLGIIGALILGQAAVEAGIVSPILIIIVAITGIGNFSIPNFSLALSVRLQRFIYIILAYMAGFLGIAVALFVHGLILTASKSFGVPYMAPYGPRTYGGLTDGFLRGPIWAQEYRPDYSNPKNIKKQSDISREWNNQKQDGDKNGK